MRKSWLGILSLAAVSLIWQLPLAYSGCDYTNCASGQCCTYPNGQLYCNGSNPCPGANPPSLSGDECFPKPLGNYGSKCGNCPSKYSIPKSPTGITVCTAPAKIEGDRCFPETIGPKDQSLCEKTSGCSILGGQSKNYAYPRKGNDGRWACYEKPVVPPSVSNKLPAAPAKKPSSSAPSLSPPRTSAPRAPSAPKPFIPTVSQKKIMPPPAQLPKGTRCPPNMIPHQITNNGITTCIIGSQ